MTDWWNALDDFEKALWAITLVATLIFVIQTIATFIGMDGDSGGGADFDGDMSASEVDRAATTTVCLFSCLRLETL